MNVRTVTALDVDVIAAAVVERIQPEPLAQFLTVAEVAARLAVGETWVYENADELGASRLGTGKRSTLRFDSRIVADFMAARAGRAA